MDNYYFVYDKDTKEEFTCSADYYDTHRNDLIAITIGDLDELREFLGCDILIIDKE